MADRRAAGTASKEAAEDGFSAEERAAMKERAAELRKAGRGRAAGKAAADLDAVLAKIAEMPAPGRALAERIHALVTSAAPELLPLLRPDRRIDGGLTEAGESALRARIEWAVGT